METILVVLDSKLRKAAHTAAKRQKVNRSALVRQALREHLRRLAVQDLEERDRRGYQARPQRVEEYLPWEEAAPWPISRP
jgi:metal-responsive CopG/Arc/MetJ family transcriptional regulator